MTWLWWAFAWALLYASLRMFLAALGDGRWRSSALHGETSWATPRTFKGFLRSPVPMVGRDVKVMEDGQLGDVYNHAAAIARLRNGLPPQ